MAATAEMIREFPPALLDPGMEAVRDRSGSRARKVTTSDPPTRGDRSYHHVGRALLESAARKGRREAAFAAVEVFRTALDGAPDEPSLRNGLGAALVELARLETSAAAVDLLSEASEQFAAALAKVTEQKAPHAASVRYRTNLAMVSWMQGERLGDADRIGAAVQTLRSVLTERPEGSARISVDWPRAQDILGCALMALRQPAEAIRAFQAAIDQWDDPIGRARSLNNLGTAYVEEGRYEEARRTYADALALQAPDDQPMARNLTQYNLGCALLREALGTNPPPPKAEKLLAEAIQAIAPARYAYRYMQSSQDWMVMTMGLANARLSYGTHLRLPGPAADRQKGIDNIEQAIALYKEVIPELTAAQLGVGLGNLQIALQILGKLSGDAQTLARLRDHVIDAIALRLGHQAKSSAPEYKYTSNLPIVKLIDNLLKVNTISIDMAGSADLLVSDILALLASSELPKTEWPGILRSALDRVGYPASRPTDEVVRRRPGGARNISAPDTRNARALNKPSVQSGSESRAIAPEIASSTAQGRFGDVPASLQRRRAYTKRNWSEADLSDDQAISEANQIVGVYNYRKKQGEHFTDAEIETYRAANSLLGAIERRRKAKTATAAPG